MLKIFISSENGFHQTVGKMKRLLDKGWIFPLEYIPQLIQQLNYMIGRTRSDTFQDACYAVIYALQAQSKNEKEISHV